jgi:hypothetical protein
MPNLKIFIDQGLLTQTLPALHAALPALRSLLCDRFGVTPPACQLAIIAVHGLPDQPLANVEMHILPRPDRTRDKVTSVCAEVQAMIGAVIGTHVAVRCSQLDAATYVALK